MQNEIIVNDLSDYGVNILTAKDEKFDYYFKTYLDNYDEKQKKIATDIIPWIIILENSSNITINSFVLKWNITNKDEKDSVSINKLENMFQLSNSIESMIAIKIPSGGFQLFYPAEMIGTNQVINTSSFGSVRNLSSLSGVDVKLLNLDIKNLDITAIKKNQINKIKRMELTIKAVEFEDGSVIGEDQSALSYFNKQQISQSDKSFLKEALTETIKFYLYINLIGEDEIFQPFYDFLKEIQAEKIAGSPIWVFMGKAEKHQIYINKMNEIFLPLVLKYGSNPTKNVSWNILLMGAQGYSGTSK